MTPSHGSSIGVAKAPKTLSFAGCAALAVALSAAATATTNASSAPATTLFLIGPSLWRLCSVAVRIRPGGHGVNRGRRNRERLPAYFVSSAKR